MWNHPVTKEFKVSLVAQCGEGNGTPLQYPCLENPMDGGAWKAAVHGVAESWTRLSDFTFTFHFPALEKEMATHSSVLAWRIPGMGETGGLPSMGSHRVGHDWSDLAAAVAQWLKIHLPMQRHQVGSPIQEDPICSSEHLSPCTTTIELVLKSPEATTIEPMCHNYWSHCAQSRALEQQKIPQWERSLCPATRE